MSSGENEPDVMILASGGVRIPAHSTVLVTVSPVIETIINRPRKNPNATTKVFPILGVPTDAVVAFVQFLCHTKCTETQMDTYGIHLLTLSHVFSVPQLKKICIKGLSERLVIENVLDVLQLSKLCDAPDLYVKCMKLVTNNFKAVEKTEGWTFMQDNDPWLELDILQFIDDVDKRKKRSRSQKKAQEVYLKLSEAMDCLEHICTEGCTSVGPYDKDPSRNTGPCTKFVTCQGLQHLIKHFAICKMRVNGGCLRCKRMWQLLQLHSSVCNHHENCKVPLCRQFKLKAIQEKNGIDIRWRLLVKKVTSAKAISSFLSSKCEEERRQRHVINAFVDQAKAKRLSHTYQSQS